MSEKNPEQVNFHFIKSNQFRVVHADGAFGGLAPSGDGIHMALYSQRQPIPLQVTHEFSNGGVGKEIARISRDGLVREIEVDVILSLPVAKSLLKWLEGKIEEAQSPAGGEQR